MKRSTCYLRATAAGTKLQYLTTPPANWLTIQVGTPHLLVEPHLPCCVANETWQWVSCRCTGVGRELDRWWGVTVRSLRAYTSFRSEGRPCFMMRIWPSLDNAWSIHEAAGIALPGRKHSSPPLGGSESS